jgi:hypothetical protein
MRINWRLTDLIDLEYFFQIDQNLASEKIHQRDRNLYLNHIQPLSDDRNQRRSFIMDWLQERRKMERGSSEDYTILPGDAFAEVTRWFSWTLAVIGFFCGISLTFSLLAYKGTAPLNVAIYFGALVVSQIGLLVLLTLMAPYYLRRRITLKRSIICSLISSLLVKITLKVKASALNKLPQAHLDSLKTTLGLAHRQKAVYGSLFFWPVFGMAQLFAVTFNIGILAATLVRVLGSDLAFGWQSTLQVSSQGVYEIVRLISLPWRWFIPSPIAHPTLAQIDGSKLVLKDGIYHLLTQDLVSWWPFLLLAVLFYGLLPRIILLAASLWIRNLKLRQLSFDTVDCDKLMGRLMTPLITTQAPPQPSSGSEKLKMPAGNPLAHTPPWELEQAQPTDAIVALVPEDIFARCSDDLLEDHIHIKLGPGYRLVQTTRIEGDWVSDSSILENLRRTPWEDDLPKVLILQEAWQPPIKEGLVYLKELRGRLGHKAKIIILLIGMPTSETIFTPVSDQNWSVWQQKITQLADPYLRLEKI